MAEIQPLRALRYEPTVAGSLQDLIAPPYDVIDADGRAALVARSPYNVVNVDLPEDPGGGDIYAHAAQLLEQWQADGAVVRDEEPALWILRQSYTGPDGRALTRQGFLARVRVTDYGAGRIRPHERTHPGPKEDRLRLTRATKANLSPIFSLYSDPDQAARRALEPHTHAEPWGEATDDEGRACCDIIMAPDLVRVAPRPKCPFQGWRYLDPREAPPDLEYGGFAEAGSVKIAEELALLGLL